MLMMSLPANFIVASQSNTTLQDWNIHDPDLSSLGLSQCQELKENLSQRFADETDAIIIVSPMRRTIQTALLSLDWLTKKGVPIQADARWQENSAKPCDTGSTIADLKVEFPGVDFSTVDPIYPNKTPPAGAQYAFNREAILGRGQSGLQSIFERKEKLVFVVSHSGFLRAGVTGYWFFNADYRVFEFERSGAPGKPFQLQQADSTLSGGLGKSRTEPVVIGSELAPASETTPLA
ncbi:phosphoglycerate mutase [Colletotrichum nymphaeae SA-01]|uniref:Phosphoglycerate mutase n=1 Tax=Colletotrichum nymphaeae SA-01 TaxID=1460502 RepID=A0A135S732_9PEZI|nr:phosphoglycerate mutase [Colletotrichum nymphaeae SA-01]